VPAVISAAIRLDSAGSVSALVEQHAEVAAGFRITQFIRPAERGLSAGKVAAIRERATEVECGIGVSALGGATVGLDGAGRIALLVEHKREVERSVRVTLLIGKAVRLFRTRQVPCCLEALAEFERRVSGDGLHPDSRGGVRCRNLIWRRSSDAAPSGWAYRAGATLCGLLARFCRGDAGHCGLARVLGAWLGHRHLSRVPLLGVGPTTPFPDALSRRFRWLGGPLGNFGGALFGPSRATTPNRL
jgi:hypothetical protein